MGHGLRVGVGGRVLRRSESLLRVVHIYEVMILMGDVVLHGGMWRFGMFRSL